MIDIQQYRAQIGRFGGLTGRWSESGGNSNINVTHNTNKSRLWYLMLLLCGISIICMVLMLCKTVMETNVRMEDGNGMMEGMLGLNGMDVIELQDVKWKTNGMYKECSNLKVWSECITRIMVIGMTMGEWMRMLEGNERDFFMHWNGGPAYMENKIEEIQQILNEKSPCFLAISESNLRENVENSLLLTGNYELLKTKSLENVNMGYSRIVIFIRKDVRYERRHDLENNVDSMIWLDILYKGGKRMTCGLIYREFKHFKQTELIQEQQKHN